ncbi:MAG: hypothetical protein FVQ79_06115, partial [Planctomycetes bacterium]|nr:hypothetical protein [Planctomycetota bacterium]
MNPPSYVVGDFDAKEIRFQHESSGVVDYARLYATNAFMDKDGRRIMAGHIRGFKPHRGWNGCMSLPRVLTLDKNKTLIQTPAPELKKLRGQHRRIENLNVVSATERLDGIEGDTMEIVAEFAPSNAAAFGLQVRCSDDGTKALTIR